LTKSPLKNFIEEDFHAWEAFGRSLYRWTFNKLEVATMQGLHCGPAATAPVYEGYYLYRPIYNLYGMGLGATKFYYDESQEMHDQMINNGIVPPGNFWCQWIEGDHLSIDYQQYSDGSWEARSVWKGMHHSEENLTRFKSWERIENHFAPRVTELPIQLDFLDDPYVAYFNIEMRGPYVIEIHLRLGNDPFDEYPDGTIIIPVWNDEVAPEGEWKGNLHEDMNQYSASGYLSDVRRGYVVKRPTA